MKTQQKPAAAKAAKIQSASSLFPAFPSVKGGKYPLRPVLLPAWFVDRFEEMAKATNFPDGATLLAELSEHHVTETHGGSLGEFALDCFNYSEDEARHCRGLLNALQDRWEAEGVKPPSFYRNQDRANAVQEPKVSLTEYRRLEAQSKNTGIPAEELQAMCLRAGLDLLEEGRLTVKAKNAGGAE